MNMFTSIAIKTRYDKLKALRKLENIRKIIK